MESLLNYFGNKNQLARKYPVPNREIICEPFAGGAGFSLYWDVPKAILIEKNPGVARIWQWLIHEATEAEILALPTEPMHPRDVEAPKHVRDLISFWQQRSAGHPKNILADSIRSEIERGHSGYWNWRIKERLLKALPLVKNWEIHCGDWTEADRIVGDRNVFWFVDPPYVNMGKEYQCSHLGLDFEKLAGWCRSKSPILVCEGPYADWLPFVKLTASQNQRNVDYYETVWIQGINDPMFEDE